MWQDTITGPPRRYRYLHPHHHAMNTKRVDQCLQNLHDAIFTPETINNPVLRSNLPLHPSVMHLLMHRLALSPRNQHQIKPHLFSPNLEKHGNGMYLLNVYGDHWILVVLTDRDRVAKIYDVFPQVFDKMKAGYHDRIHLPIVSASETCSFWKAVTNNAEDASRYLHPTVWLILAAAKEMYLGQTDSDLSFEKTVTPKEIHTRLCMHLDLSHPQNKASTIQINASVAIDIQESPTTDSTVRSK